MSYKENAEIFFEYEDLKIQEKEIKKRISELKNDIILIIPDDEAVAARHGKFEIRSRQEWTYSDEVSKLAEELDKKKAEEVAKGIATSINKSALYYVSSKK